MRLQSSSNANLGDQEGSRPGKMRLYILLATVLLQLVIFSQATSELPPTPGKWSRADYREYQGWLSNLTQRADEDVQTTPLHPVLQDFRQLVETTPRLRMLFQSMFEEVPHAGRYVHDVGGYPTIRNFRQLLNGLNQIIQNPPRYSERKNRMSFVGVPMSTLFNWPMGTPSGIAAFLDPEVNAAMQKILNVWGEYLQSPDSSYVLGTSNTDWFGPIALQDILETANVGKTNYTFSELFVSDETAPHYGFKSWDDYFTRSFNEGIRPVAAPDDDDVITNACESQPNRVKHHVKRHDEFWIKEGRYSITDMLGSQGASVVDEFVGGTVYQAYLSSLSYHRWHAPVSGRVVQAYVINGTYFAVPQYVGLQSQEVHHNYIHGMDQDHAQSYLTAVATRAVILIEADNPAIGLMAFIGVGMSEVSTCEITVKEGDRVKKGDQLGMFHFGGSTSCLMFRDGVNVTGFPSNNLHHNVPVRGQVAVVG